MKIISYSEARALGLQYYYTGKLCKYGHADVRHSSDGCCAECKRLKHARMRDNHPLYRTWYGMIYRCTHDMASNYEDYGGRGVTVCDRWLDPENGYENFMADMGPRPEGFTLDRIAYDGNYEPSNCRWADGVTQQRNRRCTKLSGEDVVEVFKMIDAGLKYRAIAAKFGCTDKNIGNIKRSRERYIEAGLDCRSKAAA